MGGVAAASSGVFALASCAERHTKRAILYFTGTGNCLCVARQLAGEGAELLSVRQLMKQGRFEVEADDMGLFTQSMATCRPTSGVLMMVGGQPQFAGIFSHHVADIYETEYVDHVEVLRGSGSVLYGSNAMGGVVRGVGGFLVRSAFRQRLTNWRMASLSMPLRSMPSCQLRFG